MYLKYYITYFLNINLLIYLLNPTNKLFFYFQHNILSSKIVFTISIILFNISFLYFYIYIFLFLFRTIHLLT